MGSKVRIFCPLFGRFCPLFRQSWYSRPQPFSLNGLLNGATLKWSHSGYKLVQFLIRTGRNDKKQKNDEPKMHEFGPKCGPRSVSFSIFVHFCGNFRQSWYPSTKGDARGGRLSKRVLNDPSEIAERSRDHSRDALAISAAILEQRII